MTGPTGNTGETGVTGSTGSTGQNCCKVGRKICPLPFTGPLVFTPTDLLNPAHGPGATYEILKFTGGDDEGPGIVDVVLPAPANEDDSFTLKLENWSDGAALRFWVGSVLSGASFDLKPRLSQERTLEEEIQSGVAQANPPNPPDPPPIRTYRTDAEFAPDGAWRIPGFAGPSD